MLRLSYLHLNIWRKPIINWVFKKCNQVKAQAQILSLRLFTKSLISNQTKAIVPKAVIWSSVIWICKAMWIENQNKMDIYPKGEENACGWQKRMTTRIAEGVSRNLKLRRLYASDNYSFPIKRFGAFFYPSVHLISKSLFWWEEWPQRTFRNAKNELCINERGKPKGLHCP